MNGIPKRKLIPPFRGVVQECFHTGSDSHLEVGWCCKDTNETLEKAEGQ